MERGRPARSIWVVLRPGVARAGRRWRSRAEGRLHDLGLDALPHQPADQQGEPGAGFLNDSLLQRIMVSIVVKPEKVPGVNIQGATALQNYLLSPVTQARVHNFRLPGIDDQIWW